MERINVYHAFNGFLYSPVFLADKLGFFPKNAVLKYTKGDVNTIDALCSQSATKEEVNFAICDPFSIDFSKVATEHTDDDICIIASLINSIPIWIYNPREEIKPVRKEADLGQFAGKINKVISYPKETTGYLLSKRIQEILGLNEQFIEEHEFGTEFESNYQDSSFIITADALRIVYLGLDKKNTIFNYSTKAPKELTPFLFTAVLTLKSNVDSHLWTALSILGGIGSSISYLSERHVEDQYIKTLVEIFQQKKYGEVFWKLGVSDQNSKEELVRETVKYLFWSEKLYSQYPKPKDSQWKKSWDNARNEWERQKAKDYPSVEPKEEPIPALLIKKNWKSELVDHFKKFIYERPESDRTRQQLKEFVGKRERGLLMFLQLVVFVSFVLLFRSAKYTFWMPIDVTNTGDPIFLGKFMFTINSMLFLCQGWTLYKLKKSLHRLADYSQYSLDLFMFGVASSAFATFIFRLLEL